MKSTGLQTQHKRQQFEDLVLPHLDSAFNLARWLMANDQDAEDVVQEAYLRAFKSFEGYRGGNSHAWLMAIVRNTAYTWLRQRRTPEVPFDEEWQEAEVASLEHSFLEQADYQLLREAIADLPVEFREVIVLHDLEGWAYKEVAAMTHIPLGTVMSRLSRARGRLQKYVMDRQTKEELA